MNDRIYEMRNIFEFARSGKKPIKLKTGLNMMKKTCVASSFWDAYHLLIKTLGPPLPGMQDLCLKKVNFLNMVSHMKTTMN